MRITRDYLESLSPENAACVIRALSAEYNEVYGPDEQYSIVESVSLAIEYAVRRDSDGREPEIIY